MNLQHIFYSNHGAQLDESLKTIGKNIRTQPSRPALLKVVVGLETFGALGGFAGGIPLIIDPSGGLLGYSPSFLAGTPISNFLLVGLWLAGIFGIGGALVAYLLWSGRGYARRLAYLLGTLTVFWVVLENTVFGPSLVLASTQLVFCGPQIASAIVLFRTRSSA